MSKIIGIVAVSPEGIIAINDKMPWHCPEDLKYFKQHTLNQVVIMGRITWETLGKNCLPNRINYVISKTGNYSLIANSSAIVFSDISDAITSAQLRFPDKDIFIIGGASIYQQTMNRMDEFYLTIIHRQGVQYTEGEKKYLKGYPFNIYNLFVEESKYIGTDATYKKYKRRVTNKINSTRLF